MDTKGHCFPKSIIIQAVYFKLRFSLSYRDIEEIMRIRGVEVDHATIQRWVYKFMPEIEIQMRQNQFCPKTITMKNRSNQKQQRKIQIINCREKYLLIIIQISPDSF